MIIIQSGHLFHVIYTAYHDDFVVQQDENDHIRLSERISI